jgi:hypothetical protein
VSVGGSSWSCGNAARHFHLGTALATMRSLFPIGGRSALHPEKDAPLPKPPPPPQQQPSSYTGVGEDVVGGVAGGDGVGGEGVVGGDWNREWQRDLKNNDEHVAEKSKAKKDKKKKSDKKKKDKKKKKKKVSGDEVCVQRYSKMSI